MFDPPLAACAMMLGIAVDMVLMLQEPGQHIAPSPAGQAELTPAIIIGRLPAHIDHRVDRGTAADHLAPRIGEPAPAETGLLDRLEHPVGARIADREEISDRDVEPDPVVLAARLEQQHPVARIR